MKKSLILVSLLAAASLFIACNKDKKEVSNSETEFVEDGSTFEEVIPEATVPCVLFYDSAYIWTENDEGTLDANIQLFIGQELLAYPAVEGSLSEVVESKEFSRNGKKEKEEYTHVSFEDKDYWINSLVIQPNSKVGLVVDPKAVVYNSPDIVDVGSRIIPQFQLVAIKTDFESPAESDVEFSQITYRSEDRSAREIYVKSSVISKALDDVLALRVLAKASTIDNKIVLDEVIENMERLQTSGYVQEKINEDLMDKLEQLYGSLSIME